MCINLGFGSVKIYPAMPDLLEMDPPENVMKFIKCNEIYNVIQFVYQKAFDYTITFVNSQNYNTNLCTLF